MTELLSEIAGYLDDIGESKELYNILSGYDVESIVESYIIVCNDDIDMTITQILMNELLRRLLEKDFVISIDDKDNDEIIVTFESHSLSPDGLRSNFLKDETIGEVWDALLNKSLVVNLLVQSGEHEVEMMSLEGKDGMILIVNPIGVSNTKITVTERFDQEVNELVNAIRDMLNKE